MGSCKHARVNKSVIGDIGVGDVFSQVSNTSSAPDGFEDTLFKIPRGYDLVAIEQQDFGRSRDGLDLVLFFKIRKLFGTERVVPKAKEVLT